MEDIFYFQDIYKSSNNYDIILYKKLLQYNNNYHNLKLLKDNFYLNFKNKMNNSNYILDIKNYVNKYKLFYFDNIYEYLSNFNFEYINIDDIDYDFIKECYNINYENFYILILIYNKKIKILNDKQLKDLFKNIKLDKNNYKKLYLFFFNSMDDNIQKNIIDLEDNFLKLKKETLFIFYKKLLKFKKYSDDDLLCYLIFNNFEFKFDKFIKLYDDFLINNINSNKKNLIADYFKNYNKINYLISKKLFFKIFPDFDVIFFSNIYSDLLRINNVKTEKELDIYNFYLKNNDLLINKDSFNKKFDNIDNKLIKILYLNNNDDLYILIKFVINNQDIYKNIYELKNKINNINFNLLLDFKNFKDNYEISKYFVFQKNPNNQLFINNSKIDMNFIREFYKIKNLNIEEINSYIKDKKINMINYENYIEINNINIISLKLFNNRLKYLDKDEFIVKNILNNHSYKNFLDFKYEYIDLIKKKLFLFKKNYLFIDLIDTITNIDTETEFIDFLRKDIYKMNINKFSIGRKNVFMIEEVLLDLELDKPKLNNGLSLIIRAKNEQKNIRLCIDSVIDLVDEIIFVNNNSTDDTLKIIEELGLMNDKIKIYNYFIDVNRVGVEHQNALKNNDNNTLGIYYNWCLSKSTMTNVIKWDADFICIKENFKLMINNYKIKNKFNKYAVWFSGYTLFMNKKNYYINLDSYYNEYRLFSYLNDFKWYDGDLCEFNEPYIEKCDEKIQINYPIFYEMKRTDIDEFNSRSSLIDERDKKDFDILNNLLNNKNNELYYLEKNKINKILNITLVVNSFDMGGSNIFILELYKYFKLFGYNVKIYCEIINKLNIKINKFKIIDSHDIFNINNENFIKDLNSSNYVIFNGYIPYNIENKIVDIESLKIFITHSDVAYSNYFIKKYHSILYKIITVNNYSKTKLNRILDIKENKIHKIINFLDIKYKNEIKLKKNKKFGIISRFSDDKNIIMLLFALRKFFDENKDYEFYLVGYENENMLRYILSIINYLKLNEFIKIEGYQNNTIKYYEMFDFIILPSVSEGCSYNLIESMIYRKLIIASNVGGNKELLKDNCIYIEYENIKDYEYNNLYITNYHGQLSILGYYIIDDHVDFLKKFSYHLNYNLKNIRVIPSILIESKNLSDNKIENTVNELKKKWIKNTNNIYNSIIKATKLNLNDRNKMINNNVSNINKNFTKLKYYENLDKIFDI